MRKIFIFASLMIITMNISLLMPNETEVQEAGEVLTDVEKIYGLSRLWEEAKYSFVYFDQVPNLDWEKAYKEFIPKVLSTENTLDYYLLLVQFYALLNDGHSRVLLPKSLRNKFDMPALYLDLIQQRIFVIGVDTMQEDQIPLGSEILKVDGINILECLEKRVLPYVSASTEEVKRMWAVRGWLDAGYGLLAGTSRTLVNLTYLTPSGEEKNIDFIRDSRRRKFKWVWKLNRQIGRFHWKKVKDKIIYLAINDFGNEEITSKFKSIVTELKKSKGVLIDLRYNRGGSTGIAKSILDYFTNRQLQGPKWKTREHRGAYKAWGKFDPDNKEYGPYYRNNAWYEGSVMPLKPSEGTKISVPLVVLIGPDTTSAAEDFLIYCDELEQVTLVGQPTNGSTGQPIFFELPGRSMANTAPSPG